MSNSKDRHYRRSREWIRIPLFFHFLDSGLYWVINSPHKTKYFKLLQLISTSFSEGKCNSTCSDHGACLFDGEKAQCYCNSGYHGESCELSDKNECQDKPCNWLAHCTNTVGSYQCECFPGFKGDGYNCIDIDECSEGMAKCTDYSKCVNLPGTYFCNCTEGFMPKGAPLEKCADIDECETGMHTCSDDSYCQNTIGSYECVKTCNKGYEFNNNTCIDVDECLNDNLCDSRANCINTIGGYKCICEDGFTGNGHTCSRMFTLDIFLILSANWSFSALTDCSQNEDVCDRHGFCINSLKMCLCETGYAGDGHTCEGIIHKLHFLLFNLNKF